jgi:tRNA threonylcarbamoyladenosine biosynthesis protein TsaB
LIVHVLVSLMSQLYGSSPPRLLILETSHRVGQVALALGELVVGRQTLDESRRHARDLAPQVNALLQQQGWHARELAGVIVSRGPGSYTGLRVGVMSAKMLAYTTRCALLAVDTFDAIHAMAAKEFPDIDVIADAQQDKVYVQRYGKEPRPLAILSLEAWLESATASGIMVTGPGLESFADRLPPAVRVMPREFWLPQPEGLLLVGLQRYRQGERDDPFAVEPLYLRPSSAEEKWQTLQGEHHGKETPLGHPGRGQDQ